MQLPEFTEKHFDLYNDSGLIFSPKLFFSIYKTIPQRMTIDEIDGAKIRYKIEDDLKDHIVHRFYVKKYHPDSKTMKYRNIIYLLKD
jgi:hypothetical protein